MRLKPVNQANRILQIKEVERRLDKQVELLQQHRKRIERLSEIINQRQATISDSNSSPLTKDPSFRGEILYTLII